jgi:protein-disulfide isomerase
MNSIVDTYGKDGKVAWVYRHFPISYGDNPLHKNAAKEAEATECAAELGGSDMFWKYLDEIYATTPSNDGLDLSQLPEIAVKVGLDKAKFQTCLDSGKYAAKVKESYDESLKAGAQGTPYTIIKFEKESLLKRLVGLYDETGFQKAVDKISKKNSVTQYFSKKKKRVKSITQKQRF